MRDLVVIPALILVTALFMGVLGEVGARAAYPSAEFDTCNILVGGRTQTKPFCVSKTKVAEGPWVVNRYNGCGYRTPEACGPKPAGSLRLAVIGASTSAGYLTPYDETFAARTAKALTHRCGRPVEVQNLGAIGNNGSRLIQTTRDAAALAPDAMVMMVAPIDFELAAKVADPAPVPAQAKSDQHSVVAAVKGAITSSRLIYMEQYFLLKSDDTYVPLYLRLGSKADFMRTPFPADWTKNLSDFDGVLAEAGAIAGHQNIPLILIYVPQRAEAAMAASDRFDHSFDPEALPTALGRMAKAHGVIFVDATRAIPKEAASATLFYAVNGHPNGRGHAILSDVFIRRLIQPDVPAFDQACRAGAGGSSKAVAQAAPPVSQGQP